MPMQPQALCTQYTNKKCSGNRILEKAKPQKFLYKNLGLRLQNWGFFPTHYLLEPRRLYINALLIRIWHQKNSRYRDLTGVLPGILSSHGFLMSVLRDLRQL